MCVWICVVGLTAECTRRNAGTAQSRYFVVPVGLPQRQLLAQCGLVDLDDLDTGGLQIEHFVADGERELLGLLLVGDVLARPGPVEDGDRAGEHALHHMVGAGLRVGGSIPR